MKKEGKARPAFASFIVWRELISPRVHVIMII